MWKCYYDAFETRWNWDQSQLKTPDFQLKSIQDAPDQNKQKHGGLGKSFLKKIILEIFM